MAIQTEAKTITPTSHQRTAIPTVEPAVIIQRTTYPPQQRNVYVSSRRWRKLVTVGHLFRAGQVSCPPLGTNYWCARARGQLKRSAKASAAWALDRTPSHHT
jgi:hypothetical protein